MHGATIKIKTYKGRCKREERNGIAWLLAGVWKVRSIRNRTDERMMHALFRRTGFHGNAEPSRKKETDKGITDG